MNLPAIDDPKRHSWVPLRGYRRHGSDGFLPCCACGRAREDHRTAWDPDTGGCVDVATGKAIALR